MRHHPLVANTSDLAAVCICFEDELINYLFSDLFESRGVPTRIVQDVTQCRGDVRIVTEPQYYPLLPERYRSTSLVVGTRTTLRGLHSLTLARPLTEERVEEALDQFLNGRSAPPAPS